MRSIILHENQLTKVIKQLVENIIDEFYATKRKKMKKSNNGQFLQIAQNFCILAYVQEAKIYCSSVNHWKVELRTAMDNLGSVALKNNAPRNRERIFASQARTLCDDSSFENAMDDKFKVEFANKLAKKDKFIVPAKQRFYDAIDSIVNELIFYNGNEAINGFVNKMFPNESFMQR